MLQSEMAGQMVLLYRIQTVVMLAEIQKFFSACFTLYRRSRFGDEPPKNDLYPCAQLRVKGSAQPVRLKSYSRVNEKRPPIQEDASLSKEFRNSPRTGKHRPELIAVNDHAAFVAVVSHFAGDHFHGHSDFNRRVVQIGQLGGDHGSFF
jgi:hypothetical protein